MASLTRRKARRRPLAAGSLGCGSATESGYGTHALRLRVAYHDACHLQHAQGVRTQPRALLGRIPQLELLEIPEAAICCGSAGIYNLVQPEAAAQLGDRKAGHIAALDADMVVSGNPGCLVQLQSALARAGRKLPVRHIVELLDASIRGVSLNASTN